MEPQLDPSDDLSVVPGVGKRTEEKLNGAGINTLSGLKAAILDTSQTDAMTALLGLNYDKILTYFQTA